MSFLVSLVKGLDSEVLQVISLFHRIIFKDCRHFKTRACLGKGLTIDVFNRNVSDKIPVIKMGKAYFHENFNSYIHCIMPKKVWLPLHLPMVFIVCHTNATTMLCFTIRIKTTFDSEQEKKSHSDLIYSMIETIPIGECSTILKA